MKTALIVGATGLIGSSLTKKLVDDKAYAKVIVILRKPLDFKHPKLEQRVVDFDSINDASIVADDVFCCLGTTMKQAGSKEAFFKVDFSYPLAVARAAANNGTKQFMIVTAMGADEKSMFYYNRVKGEIEKAIENLHFPTLLIFQPSLLLGERKDSRSGEGIASFIMTRLDFLVPRKYKAIKGDTVANAMKTMAQQGLSGKHIISSADMQIYAS